MAIIHKIANPFMTIHTGVVRNRESTPEQVRSALRSLGEEVGRQILAICFGDPAVITTPMNEQLETLTVNHHLSVIVTTKADLEVFGEAISSTLQPSKIGYMNFEGRRGLDALNAPVREIELPEVRNGMVDSVVIAKSCLATGCTAVSLARTALQEYSPKMLIIVTIFYSVVGLRELEDAFPHAHFFVVGEADDIDANGMLHPGLGLLEERV